MAALLPVIDQVDIRPLANSLRVSVVIDANAFLRDDARRPECFEAQARLGPVFIVNKTDPVTSAEFTAVKNDASHAQLTRRNRCRDYGVVPTDAFGSTVHGVRLQAAFDVRGVSPSG